MKKQFYSKLLFLFALLLTVSTSAWAETGTLQFGTASGRTKIDAASVTRSDSQGNLWTITTSGTTSFTNDKTTTEYSQVGSSKKPASSITFTATLPEKVNITDFSAKFGGFNGTQGSITLKVGDTSVGTGSLNASTDVTVSSTSAAEGNVLTITVTDIEKGVKVYEINYTYTAIGGGSETPKCATPTFSPAAGTYIGARSVEISTATEGATIHYTLDGSEPAANSSEYTSAIEVNATTTIKAIAVKDGYDNSTVATADYTIVTLEHAGTEADPYTVADAFTVIDNVGQANAHVIGIISQVDSYNSTYHSITYWISDDGTKANQLKVYSGKGINGADFSSKEDLQEGDKVVVSGTLLKYNSTYEFDYNNELVSLEREESEEPSIDVATTSVTVDYTGEENGEIEVTYNNIDKDLAEVQWFEFENDVLTPATPATYGWIEADIDANNNISYIIDENTGAARTAYLKVYALDNNANDVYSELITITQKKAPQKFTVTYYVAGAEFATAEYLEGEALNLPDPGARGGYQFAGWSTAEDAVAPKFWADDAAANSNLTLYAIFVKGVGGTVYTKVTNTEDITDGQYLIVYEADKLAFDGSRETLDASGNTIGVEITDDKKIASSEEVDAATFTINAAAGTIQSASGLYIGQTSYANGLKASDSSSYTNTFSIDEEGNVVITAVVGEQNPTLRYNDASGDNNLRFRYYKSGQKAIQLYKQTASATYTLNEPEVSITAYANATWVAPAKVKIKNDDVQVYTVTYDDAVGCARKHEVKDKVVPANGVVLLTSDAATTVTFEKTALEAKDYADLENADNNDLLGSNGNVQGGTNIFCLAVVDNVLGFYPVDSSIKVPAGKAYLKIGEDPSSFENAPSYIWFNGDTTAIDSLTTDTAAGNESGEIYSLTGQRVGKNYRGIVIMNGRKVLKK